MALENAEPTAHATTDRSKSWLAQRWSQLQARLSPIEPAQPAGPTLPAAFTFEEAQATRPVSYGSSPQHDDISF